VSPHQPEFACQQHLVTSALDGAADQLLILVGIRGVDHRDVEIEGRVDNTHRVSIGRTSSSSPLSHRVEP
jgi:hypothetical protein